MKRTVAFALIGLSLVILSVQPAAAGKRSFNLDPYGVRTTNGASRNLGTAGAAGIILPQNTNPNSDFGFGFVIPKGYKANSPIRIIFFWSTIDTSCGIVLEPEFVERTRPGHAVTTPPASGGLTPEDGSLVLLAPAVGSQGNTKVYVLNQSQGFTQQGDDAILLAFDRNGGSTNDTCPDDLVITGIRIEYITP